MDRPRARRASQPGVALALASVLLAGLTGFVAPGPAAASPLTGPSAGATGSPSARAVAVRRTVNGTTFRTARAVPAPPRMATATWVAADLDTGRILAARGAKVPRQPASTLKLLTALTASRRLPARPAHRVTYAEAHPQFCVCVGLTVGRRYSRNALLAAILLPSGNDAAEALAGSHPRGRAGFLRAMNRQARGLGLTGTRAVNPSGLTADGGSTTARDLLVLLRAAQADPRLARLLGKGSARFGPLRGPYRTITRSNPYVDLHRGAQGKTGYTSAAGYNLVVSTVVRDGDGDVRRIGVAALGAPSRDASTRSVGDLTRWVAANADDLRPVGGLPPAPGPVQGAQARWVS